MIALARAVIGVFFASLLWTAAAAAQQCGTVSTCPNASTPLSGSELMYVVQGGVSKKITTGQLTGAGYLPNTVPLTALQNQTGPFLLGNASAGSVPVVRLPMGTGVAAALAVNTGSAGSVALAGGALTPSDCLQADALGRVVTTGSPCGGGGGSGTVTSVAQSFTGGLISVTGSPITTSGTLALTVAGTSGGIPYFSGSSTWASSALLGAGALMVGGGASTAPSTITLAGDCTFSTPNITCLDTNGTPFGTAAVVNTGTSGATIPLLNGNNVYSGTANFTSTFSIAGHAMTFPSSAATLLYMSGSFVNGDCLEAVGTAGAVQDALAPCGSGSGGGSIAYVKDFIAGTDFAPGSTQSLTISPAPPTSANLAITFDGVNQASDTWSQSAGVITFNAPIPCSGSSCVNGTFVVEARWLSAAVGAGTVTTVSVVSANGFAGTVANATSTPAITLSTTVTGLISGNGTAIAAATLASADVWVGNGSNVPIAVAISGDATLANTGALSVTQLHGNTLTNGDWCLTNGTIITCTVTPITNNNQLSNGAGYLTANQSITLSGDTTGTGTTAITTTTAKVNGVSYGTAPSTNTVPVVTGSNAVTYEAVPNAALANSTISGIALGSNLDTLTFGTHLTSGASSYNGGTAATITSDCTAAATVSTMMCRDSSNQVAATTFTGHLVGAASLNVLKAGDTMTGELITVATATGTAGFNLPPGTAPTSCVSGDLWTTSSGLFACIASSPVGPFTAAGGSGTVNSSSIGNVAYYAATGTAVSGETPSAFLDASFGSTQGEILYRDSALWKVLAVGTSGYFLETQGASANPTWAPASGGTGCVTGGFNTNPLTSNGAGGCTTDTNATLVNGALALGSSGTLGSITYGNGTSGTVTEEPVAGALGTSTIYLPSIGGTIVTTAGGQSIAGLTVTTTFTATGLVTLADIATQANNTVLLNASGGVASPTAYAMSDCHAAGDATIWTAGTGFGCNSSITAAAVPATGVTAGALGSTVTINNANWSGTVLAAGNGGTNCSSASITCFNNITGFTAVGATGTTSTDLVFSTSPTLVTPTLGVAAATSLAIDGCTIGGNYLCSTGSVVFSSTLSTGTTTVTSNGSSSIAVGANGATNPVLQVDASASTVKTGLKITGAAAAGGLALAVISSGTNENLTIDAKGSGTVTINGTATGAVTITPAATFGAGVTAASLATPSSNIAGSLCATSAGIFLYNSGANCYAAAANVASLNNASSDTSLTLTGTGSGPWTGAVTVKLNLSNAQTWAAAQTFTNGDLLLKGSSSGAMTLEAPAVASTYVMTFPAATDTVAVLGLADQTLSGGANVTAYNPSAGNVTPDCGKSPLQWILNTGAFAITAPTSVSASCILRVVNGTTAANAGAVTLTNFSGKSPHGDTFATTATISAGTCSFTNSSANITWTASASTLPVGSMVFFATTGGLPTNFSVATIYYVLTNSGSVVTVSATPGGSAVTAGSAGTGTQTCYEPSVFDLMMDQIDGPVNAAWSQVQ